MIDVEEDMVGEDGAVKWEMVELWQRDPVECVEELIGNPTFRDMMVYVPECAYVDQKGENGSMMRCGQVSGGQKHSKYLLLIAKGATKLTEKHRKNYQTVQWWRQ